MFARGSRYEGVPVLMHADAQGRERPYVGLRLIPPTPGQARALVAPGDRLDLLAHRHLGDPEQFWRLCDANRALPSRGADGRAGPRPLAPCGADPMTGFALTFGLAPAPPAIVEAVQEIEVECSVDVASAFTLRLGLSRTALGDWSPLESGVFRPLLQVGVRVQVGTGLPEASSTALSAPSRSSTRTSPARRRSRSPAWTRRCSMNLEDKVTAWPNMPDGAIAAPIFGQHRDRPARADDLARARRARGPTCSAAATSASCGGSRGATGSTATCSPSRSPGSTRASSGRRSSPGRRWRCSRAMGTDTTSRTSGPYDMTRPTTVVVCRPRLSTTQVGAAGARPAACSPARARAGARRLSPPPVARPARRG